MKAKCIMKKIKAKEINSQEFLPYGFSADFVNPISETIGTKPIEFFRDILQQNLGHTTTASFSTCRVEPRLMVIDTIEYHTECSEGILPLDNNIIIHVAPATPADCLPLDAIRAFRIPKGTMVILRPGVWHHAPFTTNADPANVLIVLPERTYANDCKVITLKEDDRIEIEG